MIKRKKKSPEEIRKQKEKLEKRNTFFTDIWNNRPHRCEITGQKLFNPINSMYFHHILPKSKWEIAEFDEENIILLQPEIHAKVEQDMYFYKEINNRRKKLLEKYGK